MTGLSVIIITRNEEADLDGALASVQGLADEIVLVDSGSTDRTLDIARRYTEKYFHRDWSGYSDQKQHALEKASGSWVLNLDADERVTPELKAEILHVLKGSPLERGFAIPFHHYFMGRHLRYGGVGHETHVRLFHRPSSNYGKQRVHEGVEVRGSIGRLKQAIEHRSYRDIGEYLRKCNEYTTTIANAKAAKGQRFHFYHHLRLPFEFVMRYFVKLGFLDGEAGLTYALLSSYYVWLKFLKLRDAEAKA